jgi:hypothetical protein
MQLTSWFQNGLPGFDSLQKQELLSLLRRVQDPGELNYLYPSPSIIRIMKARLRWAGHVARMGEKRNAYKLLVGKPERRRPLGRPRRRWLDNIRMDLGEVGWGDVDWIGLAQDRDRWRALVNSVLNIPVPQNAGKISSVQTTRKSRRMRWTGHVAPMGEKRNAYRLLVGKSEGRRPLGRSRRRWVDNIRMDL